MMMMMKTPTTGYDDNQSLANDEYFEELDFKRRTFNNAKLIENFNFTTKLTRDAIKDLNAERSKSYNGSYQNVPVVDYWKIKPPDFRYSQFDPKPMSSKERAKLKREQVKEMKQNAKPKSAPVLTLHAKEFMEQGQFNADNKIYADFKRKFHILEPQEDRILNLKNFITKTGPYQNPKDHDFRQYLPPAALGLSEFSAVKEPDPFNLNFKRELLKFQLQKDSFKIKNTEFRDVDPGPQLGDKRKTPLPKFNAELKLPKDSYPNKHEEFTRYRRLNRSVQSAFMEKVENKLNKKWENDWKERIEYLEKLKKLRLHQKIVADKAMRASYSQSQTSVYTVD